MNFRYWLGALISIPLLPIMYYQGKRIMESVPSLQEARGTTGESKFNTETNKSKLKIIAIGESTIAGVGVKTHEEGFTGTFGNEISRLFNREVEWKVYARNGYTAQLVERKIIPKIKETEADIIIVGLGGNDSFTLNRPSKWNKEIRLLIESLKSKFPNGIIVFCNMPPIKEFPAFTSLIKFTIGNLGEILGKELEKVVETYKDVYYFGEKIIFKNWIEKYETAAIKEDFFSDGVHPSKFAYQTWAIDIANKMYHNKEIRIAL